MDLIKFKERYPIFLIRMKEAGYYVGYIEKYERMIRLILDEGGDESISSYEQFYYCYVNFDMSYIISIFGQKNHDTIYYKIDKIRGGGIECDSEQRLTHDAGLSRRVYPS